MALVPRYRRTWSRPIATLTQAIARDPHRAFQLMRGMKLTDTTALQCLSLAIHGRDFLVDIYSAASEAGIRPFLMWGTLLGAVREGGLLAHDYDIDLGLLPADYERREAFIGAMLKRGYFFVADKRYKFRLIRRDHVLFADFDLFYPAGDRMICLSAHKSGGYYGASFPASSFAAMRPLVILDGLEVVVPDPPEPVLEAIYGPGWRVPDPGYRSRNDLMNRLTIPAGEPIPLPPFADP